VFLHGNPDTCELWDGVIARMETRHRCLAPDLPAFGRSQEPEDFDCSLEGLAAWVDDVAGALRLSQPIDLVVHDLGGFFGLAWAALEAPARLLCKAGLRHHDTRDEAHGAEAVPGQ
jgi:pimeloyl-ACP methyl ester carboxylesterase